MRIIGALSLAVMEDDLNISDLEFWMQAFVSHSHLATYLWTAGQVFNVIPSYPNLNSFHETYSPPYIAILFASTKNLYG